MVIILVCHCLYVAVEVLSRSWLAMMSTCASVLAAAGDSSASVPSVPVDAKGECKFEELTKWQFLMVYGFLGVAVGLCFAFKLSVWVPGATGAMRRLHLKMISAIVHAPVSFFDKTPAGRILNRCSSDQAEIDDEAYSMLDLYIRIHT